MAKKKKPKKRAKKKLAVKKKGRARKPHKPMVAHPDSPDEIFVLGNTPEERAKMLYIRFGMTPAKIIKKLIDHGDEAIPAKTLTDWVRRGGWVQLKKDFALSYEAERVDLQAKGQAMRDETDVATARQAYGAAADILKDSLLQKLDFKKVPNVPAPILTFKEHWSASETLKTLQEVAFRSLGIPDMVVVDPTQGHEGITILAAGEDGQRAIAQPMADD